MPHRTAMPPKPKQALTRPKAIGAYIFAGGFSVGVMEHFDVLCHLEESDYGVKTARANFPTLPIHVGPEAWPLQDLKTLSAPFIYGNPPCAAWSVAGYTKTRGRDKWKTDPRVACTEKHFKLLEELRPKVWVWESVTQAFTKGRKFCDSLARRAIGMGYSVTYLLHNAKWYGLPQVRKRFFMVCHNVEFHPLTPVYDGMPWGEPPTPAEVLATATKAARSGTPCCTSTDTERHWTPERLAKVLPGERLSKHWERHYANGDDPSQWERNENGTVKGRPSFGHFRLPVDRPGNAVVGYKIIHPVENRFITSEEIQLLSGFPPDYKFTPGGVQARMSEIARGVCPPVGEWLARSVLEAIRANVPITMPAAVLVNLIEPPGFSEEVRLTDLDQEVTSEDDPLEEADQVQEVTAVTQAPRPKFAVPPPKKVTFPPPKAPAAAVAAPKPKTSGNPEKNDRIAPPRPAGIGAYIRELLLQGVTPDAIIKKVKERFPQSRATTADVAWNRSRLRKEGKLSA